MEENTKPNRVKTSWYIEPTVLEALNFIKEEVGIPISRQIEMGAKLFLEQYKDMLSEENIDPWQR